MRIVVRGAVMTLPSNPFHDTPLPIDSPPEILITLPSKDFHDTPLSRLSWSKQTRPGNLESDKSECCGGFQENLRKSWKTQKKKIRIGI